MKKTQKLEANRNIKDQLSSFISIVVIAMLAVTVYLGIAFSARAMDVNISGYYNRLNMQDLVVYSPLLMTGDDAEAIRAVDGVAEVELRCHQRLRHHPGRARCRSGDHQRPRPAEQAGVHD